MTEDATGENRLGNKITTLREAHHLTSQDLADRCGCDVALIQELEAGEVPASLAPLIKITRALGVRLGGTRFTRCDLQKADLRTAEEYAIDLETNKLKGARFSFPDVVRLLDGTGIVIE